MPEVVVSSFHSTSARILHEYSPDAIVSLDSHLDTSHFHLEKVFQEIKGIRVIKWMPEEWVDCLTRKGSHRFIRGIAHAKFFVVVPKECLALGFVGDAGEYLEYYKVIKLFGGSRNGRIDIEKVVKIAKKALESLGMSIYLSPPRELTELAKKVSGPRLALDIDADYMDEFQDSCFTPAPHLRDGPKPILGTIQDVLEFVKLARPDLITFSEAKSGKARGSFLSELGKIGYEVRDRLLLSDDVATSMVDACDNFWKSLPKEGMLVSDEELKEKLKEFAKSSLFLKISSFKASC